MRGLQVRQKDHVRLVDFLEAADAGAPSKPMPSAKVSASTLIAEAGSEVRCQVPGMSDELKSTILIAVGLDEGARISRGFFGIRTPRAREEAGAGARSRARRRASLSPAVGAVRHLANVSASGFARRRERTNGREARGNVVTRWTKRGRATGREARRVPVVFITGPRRAGKSAFAERLALEARRSADLRGDRRAASAGCGMAGAPGRASRASSRRPLRADRAH